MVRSHFVIVPQVDLVAIRIFEELEEALREVSLVILEKILISKVVCPSSDTPVLGFALRKGKMLHVRFPIYHSV